MSSKIIIWWRRINLLLILPSQWERLDKHWTGTASHLSQETHTHGQILSCTKLCERCSLFEMEMNNVSREAEMQLISHVDKTSLNRTQDEQAEVISHCVCVCALE